MAPNSMAPFFFAGEWRRGPGVDFWAKLRRGPGLQRKEWGGDGTLLLPGFDGAAQVRGRAGFFMGVGEPFLLESFARLPIGEAKGIGTSGASRPPTSRWTTPMVVAGRVASVPIREACSGAGFEDAVKFAKRTIDVGEEHHAEAGGGEVELLVGEGELLRVGLLSSDVSEATPGCAFCGDGEEVGTEVERGYVARGRDSGGDADGGFTGTAGQVEDFDAGLGIGIRDQSLGYVAAHGGGFGFPFFRGGHAEGRAPVGLEVAGHWGFQDFKRKGH